MVMNFNVQLYYFIGENDKVLEAERPTRVIPTQDPTAHMPELGRDSVSTLSSHFGFYHIDHNACAP